MDSARRRDSAFTLMEVLLAVLLLVLLSSALVLSLYSSLDSVRIEENVSRFRSLLRAARADAALNGRRLQLSFDETTTQPMISIETDPLEEPNEFKPYLAWWVNQARLTGDVRVKSCELTGASAFRERTADGGSAEVASARGADGVLSPVTFTPDGGSDSVRIILGFENEEESPWTVEITLNGTDGTIQATRLDLLTEEELDEREAREQAE